MSHERIWRSVVLLLVVCLHLWLGWTWASQHPGPLIAALRPRIASSETVVVLTFVTRTDAVPKTARLEAARRLAKPLARSTPATAATDLASVPYQPADRPARLNLAIPAVVRSDAYRRDVLEHRPGLENTTTRFDRAWLSDGTLVDVAAKRSVVASVILGALGALTKPCTAKQVRNYDPSCVPDQYVHRIEDDYPEE